MDKKLGYFCIVDFSEEAKNKSLGYDFLKKIYHYYDGYLIKIEAYSPIKVRELKRNDVFVYDKTKGLLIPRESQFLPSAIEILGRLQIIHHV